LEALEVPLVEGRNSTIPAQSMMELFGQGMKVELLGGRNYFQIFYLAIELRLPAVHQHLKAPLKRIKVNVEDTTDFPLIRKIIAGTDLLPQLKSGLIE
jgi:hypothetical protein